MPYVYVITNSVNDKFYAGSTNDPARRWSEHKKKLKRGNHPTPYLQASWNKHGGDNFSFTVVCECSDELRNFYEDLFIAKASYNHKTTSFLVAPCSREKISAARKGMVFSESHKKAISESKKGKPVSETRRNQLQSQWDEFFTDKDWVAKRSESIKERYKDPALREKMRQQALRRWNKNAIQES